MNKKTEQLKHHITDNQCKHALTTNQGVKIAEDEFSLKMGLRTCLESF
ncbi:hypothetical protein [Bacillus sp. FSL R12-0069]